ncbi:MAG: sialidase family protein, partial [Verrucomicrobiota bacterium]
GHHPLAAVRRPLRLHELVHLDTPARRHPRGAVRLGTIMHYRRFRTTIYLVVTNLFLTLRTLSALETISPDMPAPDLHYGPSPNSVFIDPQTGYLFHVSTGAAATYRKTTDGGRNWSAPIALGTLLAEWDIAIWYDRWTPGDTAGTKIHIAVVGNTASTVDDLLYTYIDTGNGDSLGPVTTVAAGLQHDATADGKPTICKATDGILMAAAGGNYNGGDRITAGFSFDDGATWFPADPSVTDDQDQVQLLPLHGGDVLMVRHDRLEADLESAVWSSGAGWSGWTLIETNWHADTTHINTFGASINRVTGHAYLVGGNAPLTATGDVKAYRFDGNHQTWSVLADVVTDDSIAGGTVMVDPTEGTLYAIYATRPMENAYERDGRAYVKCSTDDGATWGPAEVLGTRGMRLRHVRGSLSAEERPFAVWFDPTNEQTANLNGTPIACWNQAQPNEVIIEANIVSPRGQFGTGGNVVFIDDQTGYVFYISLLSPEVFYRKTIDGGLTWSAPVRVPDGQGQAKIAVWYDRWTPGDDTGTSIHLAHIGQANDDLRYRSLDTADDRLSPGWITIYNGAQLIPEFDAGCNIVKTTDGNLFVSGPGMAPGGVRTHSTAWSADGGMSWTVDSPATFFAIEDAQIFPLSNGEVLILARDRLVDDLRYATWNPSTGWNDWTHLGNFLDDPASYPIQWVSEFLLDPVVVSMASVFRSCFFVFVCSFISL